jgi:nucleoside-diphosphate-sugar epimerase
MNYWLDINKAKKSLDWEPKVTLEEGIKKIISSMNLN